MCTMRGATERTLAPPFTPFLTFTILFKLHYYVRP